MMPGCDWVFRHKFLWRALPNPRFVISRRYARGMPNKLFLMLGPGWWPRYFSAYRPWQTIPTWGGSCPNSTSLSCASLPIPHFALCTGAILAR